MGQRSFAGGAIAFVVLVSCQRESEIAAGPCNGGIIVPAGFCATIVADKLGAIRHMVVGANSDLFVARWEGKSHPGGIIRLRDTTLDGRADVIDSVVNSGGSGIAILNGYIYQSTWSEVLRYRLNENGFAGRPDTIITGLPRSGHAARSIVIDSAQHLYITIGAPTNSCQIVDRGVRSLGRDPCNERESFAGIWRFDAKGLRQKQSDGERWVTGLRHVVAFTLDVGTGAMVGVQHGRDELHENFPQIFDEARGARLPAEAMYSIEKGSDYGWPYCYYDDSLRRSVLAPEYGGDGVRTSRCEKVAVPIAAFPAHWAPNGLLFYRGTQFPERYRGGAFIAFHGGWYRPPPDNGFNVVFVPFADNKPVGPFEIFADGFAGRGKRPGRALHRPTGLAQSPDGTLFISDDAGGRIWRITYSQH